MAERQTQVNFVGKLSSDDRAETCSARPYVRWYPVRSELTVFMHQRIDCVACLMIRQFNRRPLTPVLHVRRTGDTLIITEADDLHKPGRYLAAKYVREDELGSVFHLLDEAPAGMAAERFRPGQGTALVTYRQGRQGLIVTGSATGLVDHDGVLIEAFAIDG